MKPSNIPSREKRFNSDDHSEELFEAWLENVECPEGTIPILRDEIFNNHRHACSSECESSAQ